jgi:hypothetical protein
VPVPGQAKQITDAGGAFSLSVPGDWQVRQQPGGAMGSDPTGTAMFLALAAPKMVTDLQQFAQVSVGQMQQQVPGWQQLRAQAIQVGARQGLYIQAVGQPGGMAVVGHYVLVVTERHQVQFTVLCPQAQAAQWQTAIQQIVASFQVP